MATIWNYRVLKTNDGICDTFSIREVFYDATGKPDMFGPEEEVIGFELSDLSYLMRIMGLALERPVLTVDDFKPKGSDA